MATLDLLWSGMRAILFFLWGCSSPSLLTETATSEAFWAHWSGGQAEVASYALTQPRYGELRQGTAVLVFVTERLNPTTLVKAESAPSSGRPVFKLNDIRAFQTGVYDYHTMTSTFLPLDGSSVGGTPLKVSASVQEWCGHTWERLKFGEHDIDRVAHSYFEAEGEQTERWAYPERPLVLDSVPLTLRAHPESLLESPGSLQVQWLSSRVDARLEHVQSRWREGTLTLEPDVVPRQVGEETVASQVWRLDGQGLSRTWWIEEAPPHRLLGWQTSSGESASLIASKRMAYWDAQRAQDRKLRHELGL